MASIAIRDDSNEPRPANMQIERGKAFIEHEPELTAEEAERARNDGKHEFYGYESNTVHRGWRTAGLSGADKPICSEDGPCRSPRKLSVTRRRPLRCRSLPT
jgi:hypothetical protein